MESDFAQRLEDEKTKWTASLPILGNGSPGTSLRQQSSIGIDHLTGSISLNQSHGRKQAVFPLSALDSNPPSRPNTSNSFRAQSNGIMAEAPSVMDQEEYFSSVPPTPSSQAPTHRGVNDLISTSKVGAGPSVQLVERMSASVRRLESEKAAAKDELTRLTAQRDEARQEVVSLMRQVESKQADDQRLKALEGECQSINARYQTTLELLGEKSELVEELRADVADVKGMYRDLVDKTMK